MINKWSFSPKRVGNSAESTQVIDSTCESAINLGWIHFDYLRLVASYRRLDSPICPRLIIVSPLTDFERPPLGFASR